MGTLLVAFFIRREGTTTCAACLAQQVDDRRYEPSSDISPLLLVCPRTRPLLRPCTQVTLGVLSSIAPSTSDACTDGDGTSLMLLAGVVRTEVGNDTP